MTEGSTQQAEPRAVLVLGAYGLIGAGVCLGLIKAGHNVTGLGRDPVAAKRAFPDMPWRFSDIAVLQTADDWRPLIDGHSVVVNCSGALQDGPKDQLEALHHRAIAALAEACASTGTQLVQISAVGAQGGATTDFLSTKARGDDAIRSSGASYQILRPGLVLAANAYGGSAMLRMLAAVPFVQPIAMGQAQVQTVALDHVADCVVAAAEGRLPDRFEADLVEASAHSLRDLVASIRTWMGFGTARLTIELPKPLTHGVGKTADFLSKLGWRSPLRTTALRVLETDVTGKPADMGAYGVSGAQDLHATLRDMAATSADRLAARMALLMPVVVAGLAIFWFLSGLIGLLRVNAAASVLTEAGWGAGLAITSVLFWSVVDIAIAVGFVIRRYAPLACWAAVVVSLFYLAATTVFVPSIWGDPLGPMVKVIPSILLALTARAMLETR